MNWDLKNDDIVFEMKDIASSRLNMPYTKRNILKISATFFDQIGFICPVVLQPKLLFQTLCSWKVDWDEAVKNEICLKWELLKDLLPLGSIRVERFVLGYIPDEILELKLHGFCDSSEVAYAAAVYVRVVTNVGIKISLLCRNSKVAPLKKISIPRLEVLSCLLLTRLLISVRDTIEVELTKRTVCWSDAEITLYWIKGVKKEWKPWVENRVNLIRDRTSCDNWRHIPGDLNPADLATREGVVTDVMCNRWQMGPEFLLHDDTFWPKKEFGVAQQRLVLEEAKKPSINTKATIKAYFLLQRK